MSLRAGSARAVLGPLVGLPMAGYPTIVVEPDGPQDHSGYVGREGPCVGVLDDLYVRAVAVDDGHRSAVMVSLDVLIVPKSFTDDVRAAIAARGITVDVLLLAATHNHSGPDYTGFYNDIDQSVTAAFVDRTAETIANAVAQLQPVDTVALTFGELPGLTINRRHPGHAVDTEVPVLRIDAVGGTTVAVVYGYACHPIIIGSSSRVASGEFAGQASRLVESALGPACTALYFNGAAGNLNPRAFPYGQGRNIIEFDRGLHYGDVATVRTPAEAVRFGNLLGAEVVRAALTATGCNDMSLGLATRSIDVDLKVGDDRARFLRHVAQSAATEARWTRATTTTELVAVRIGDVAFQGIPGEPFVEIGLQLQRSRPNGVRVRTVGLANDYMGYITSSRGGTETRYEDVNTPLSAAGTIALIEAAEALRDEILATGHYQADSR